MKPYIRTSYQKYILALLIAVGLVRLLSLGAYPLADTTEARYGEIARLMVTTGDWITPQISEGTPFWGKPPLSFWLTAISFKLFGFNEFAARLPSFLLGLAVIAMVWHMAIRQKNTTSALIACLTLTSSVLFWISSGAVMTDHCLLAGTTLSMVSFWQAMHTPGKKGHTWGYVFFIGMAIGLLAKGPVALVLICFPVAASIFFRKNHLDVWKKIPWITGLVLLAVLTVPWYWLAETESPGFLSYFLIGEHWNRFLVPGWKGDLYGSAHSRPKGMIWLYWLISAFPWSVIVPLGFCSKKIRKNASWKSFFKDEWTVYLILWSVFPMVFFTLAGNILPAYVLPGLPAFSLLTAGVLTKNGLCDADTVVKWGAAAMLFLFSIATIIVYTGIGPSENSQKKLMETFYKEIKGGEIHITYLFKRPFSAAFYSKGTARKIDTTNKIDALLKNGDTDYMAVKENRLNRIPAPILNRFSDLGHINRYILLKEK
jgi:4-amino-4-deoxy-L-arabinose transferase-like glycosyltransferase